MVGCLIEPAPCASTLRQAQLRPSTGKSLEGRDDHPKRPGTGGSGTEEDNQMYGARESLHLSQAGELTQFVAHVQTLQPGSRSSDRHWHEEEDEFLYVISGEATVIEEDGPHTLHPEDAACWPAGTANAQQVVNRSDAPCTYLIFGSGAVPDVVHYPERGRSCAPSKTGRGESSAPTGP